MTRLLWSLIINGTEELKVRVNVYPLRPATVQAGVAFGLTDANEPFIAVSLNMPLGVGVRF